MVKILRKTDSRPVAEVANRRGLGAAEYDHRNDGRSCRCAVWGDDGPVQSQVFTVDGKEILHLTGQDLADLLAKEAPIRAERRTRIIIWNLDEQGLHPMTYDEVQRLKSSDR